MSILDLTLSAQYKGVPFLVKNAPTSGGIKSVKHLFPNSTNQVIENLGALQNTFTIEAWITNDPTQDNYITKRDALIAVLNSGKRGLLVHPLFGRIDNVISTNWSVAENFTELGVASFSITFEIDLPQSVPQVAANTFSQVQTAQINATNGITSNLGTGYGVEFFNNITDSVSQVNGFVESLLDNTRIFSITANQLNPFAFQVQELAANVVSLINTPADLADTVDGIFLTMSTLYDTTEETFEVLTQFFDFGGDDIGITGDTASKIERRKNRELFNNSIQGYALAYSYSTAGEIEFNTVDEQQVVQEQLEEQYDSVVANVTIPTLATISDTANDTPPSFLELGLSTDTKALLTDQRIATENLFDDNSVTLGRIITVLTPLISARLLAYQYYGDSELGEDIAQLNEVTDPAFIEGNVRIITQ